VRYTKLQAALVLNTFQCFLIGAQWHLWFWFCNCSHGLLNNYMVIKGKTFKTIEEEVGTWWLETLRSQMISAGIQERDAAIREGKFDEDVPAITVITDGGWSKRSHKHTYNAAGGVAIIVGAVTGKLLYIGIRNKQCATCSRANRLHTPVQDHACSKNWTQSSQAMEADIILQGFKEAESGHGLLKH